MEIDISYIIAIGLIIAIVEYIRNGRKEGDK